MIITIPFKFLILLIDLNSDSGNLKITTNVYFYSNGIPFLNTEIEVSTVIYFYSLQSKSNRLATKFIHSFPSQCV